MALDPFTPYKCLPEGPRDYLIKCDNQGRQSPFFLVSVGRQDPKSMGTISEHRWCNHNMKNLYKLKTSLKC